jgi:transcription initiation factor TFIIB
MKFVPGIASKLLLDPIMNNMQSIYCEKQNKFRGLTGKDPRFLAAPALYKASIETNDKRIQKDIAEAAGTTEVSLRIRHRGIENILHS